MANDKDKLYEKVYLLWKGEGEKRNQSIDWYCQQYGVKVEDFRKWYQGISKAVKEIQVIGRPENVEPQTPKEGSPEPRQPEEPRIVITTNGSDRKPKENTIAITLKMGNGLHLTRKGMSYPEFLTLAQNLKVLC